MTSPTTPEALAAEVLREVRLLKADVNTALAAKDKEIERLTLKNDALRRERVTDIEALLHVRDDLRDQVTEAEAVIERVAALHHDTTAGAWCRAYLDRAKERRDADD